ncbi:hypothetical protein PR202_ga29649 [Eleusine coracana subsp. coracana]|uniref:Uncharacterized protein n=1 Tax=Eleusine coracana subsp. coracana TaxID=191504 RepID=A0AAV5DLD3_ELECO|nr:hypothetical protein PR202_ga29649 [Eleusine coracana subsp. coracana]
MVQFSLAARGGLAPCQESEEEELEIPACSGVTEIELKLDYRWRLRLPLAGMFTALHDLTLQFARVEGSELTALVSTQCPRLRTLRLCVTLCVFSDVTLRTDSLESLMFHVDNTR